jgi:hypothetical protein
MSRVRAIEQVRGPALLCPALRCSALRCSVLARGSALAMTPSIPRQSDFWTHYGFVG